MQLTPQILRKYIRIMRLISTNIELVSRTVCLWKSNFCWVSSICNSRFVDKAPTGSAALNQRELVLCSLVLFSFEQVFVVLTGTGLWSGRARVDSSATTPPCAVSVGSVARCSRTQSSPRVRGLCTGIKSLQYSPSSGWDHMWVWRSTCPSLLNNANNMWC